MVIFIDTERNLVICRDRVACFANFFFFLVTSVNSFNSFVYYCCIFFVI